MIASLLVGVGVTCLWFRTPAADAPEGKKSVKAAKSVSVVKNSRKKNLRKVTEISLSKDKGKTSVRIVESQMARPNVAVSSTDIDEDQLSAEQKKVLAELQQALDDNNLRRVRQALSKLMASAKGGQVPICIRMKAVEALGWFGKDAAIDIMEFMADDNEEVASEAFTQFEQALQDCDMSDAERSAIVKSAMTALTDMEQIDTLLNQLNDMRNSRKAETITYILENGTAQAKQLMIEQLPDYTDGETETPDGVKKWLAENPDDEMDEEFYGGSKSEQGE